MNQVCVIQSLLMYAKEVQHHMFCVQYTLVSGSAYRVASKYTACILQVFSPNLHYNYGVATARRLPNLIGLSCKRALFLAGLFCKSDIEMWRAYLPLPPYCGLFAGNDIQHTILLWHTINMWQPRQVDPPLYSVVCIL